MAEGGGDEAGKEDGGASARGRRARTQTKQFQAPVVERKLPEVPVGPGPKLQEIELVAEAIKGGSIPAIDALHRAVLGVRVGRREAVQRLLSFGGLPPAGRKDELEKIEKRLRGLKKTILREVSSLLCQGKPNDNDDLISGVLGFVAQPRSSNLRPPLGLKKKLKSRKKERTKRRRASEKGKKSPKKAAPKKRRKADEEKDDDSEEDEDEDEDEDDEEDEDQEEEGSEGAPEEEEDEDDDKPIVAPKPKPKEPAGPTTGALLEATKTLMKGADLETLSRKQLLQQLSKQFGMDLTPRRPEINRNIAAVLGELMKEDDDNAAPAAEGEDEQADGGAGKADDDLFDG